MNQQQNLSSISLLLIIFASTLGATTKAKNSNCDDSNLDSLTTLTEPDLVLNAQGIDVSNANIPYRRNHLYVTSKNKPEFCLDISLQIDSILLDRNRFCYKSTKIKKNVGYGGYGIGKSNYRKIQNYSARSVFTDFDWKEHESEITIHQFVGYMDSSFHINVKLISDSAGMHYRSDINPPLKMIIVKTSCIHKGDCKVD